MDDADQVVLPVNRPAIINNSKYPLLLAVELDFHLLMDIFWFFPYAYHI
jgi:hypothetical protein